MKKFAMTLLALLACATSGVQAQYSTYYKDMPVEVRQVEPFAIADRSVNLPNAEPPVTEPHSTPT